MGKVFKTELRLNRDIAKHEQAYQYIRAMKHETPSRSITSYIAEAIIAYEEQAHVTLTKSEPITVATIRRVIKEELAEFAGFIDELQDEEDYFEYGQPQAIEGEAEVEASELEDVSDVLEDLDKFLGAI